MPISQIVTNSIANGAVVADDLANGSVTAAKLASAQTLSVNGITFPATQVPSGDANTLDDYEEGSFTPFFTSTTATYETASTVGRYVKIGQMVFVTGVVTTTSLTRNGNNLAIGGLPFTVADFQADFSPTSQFIETGFNPAGGAGNIMGICATNSTAMVFYVINSSTGNNYTSLTHNDLQTGSNRIRFAACYRQY